MLGEVSRHRNQKQCVEDEAEKTMTEVEVVWVWAYVGVGLPWAFFRSYCGPGIWSQTVDQASLGTVSTAWHGRISLGPVTEDF